MKVKSEAEILELLKIAKEHGEVTFLSKHVEGDRQKIYRVLRALEEEMPLLRGEYEFTVRGSAKHGAVTIEQKKEETTLIVPRPPEVVKQVVEKPKRDQKKPAFIEDVEQKIKDRELWVQKHIHEATLEQLRDEHEVAMIRRIAIEYYLETKDEVFIPVIKCETRDWPEQVQAAFNPYFGVVEERKEYKELTDREKIIWLAERIGEVINSTSAEEQRELEQLIREKERLQKLEDAKWTEVDNLLG